MESGVAANNPGRAQEYGRGNRNPPENETKKKTFGGGNSREKEKLISITEEEGQESRRRTRREMAGKGRVVEKVKGKMDR